MKRALSLVLSLALLLSCISGITLFTAADELPAPFGYFNFGGSGGLTQKDIGVVRHIQATETNTDISRGKSIGNTGLYGITGGSEGRGLYFGGTLLNGVPENTGVVYAVEYYVNSDVPLNGNVLLVTDSKNGEQRYADLKIGEAGVVFYSLSAAGVDAIRGNDTRLRMKVLGEGVDKVYITGVKILDASYCGMAEAVPYSYYDFEKTVTNPYYPDEEGGLAAHQMSYVDAEATETFEGYRYFSLTPDAPAWAAEENVNKPVYVRFFTKEGHENTTIGIDTYQVYGEKKSDGQMAATHSALIKDAPSVAATITDGVGGLIIPAAYLRNGAGPGSFRVLMSQTSKIARIEVYDVTTYCGVDGADAAVAEAMHAFRTEKMWNVTSEGYRPPSQEQDGYTGTVVCKTCGETLAEGKPIPKAVAYAQFDYTSGTAASMAVSTLMPLNGTYSSIQPLPNGLEHAMKVTAHNDGIKFALNPDQLTIDEEDLLNGTKLAVTVEYYLPSAHDNNARIAFETANSKPLAFYKNMGDTTWDAVCVNPSAPLATDKTAIATFILGDGVTYTAAKGQFGGNDKFDTPREIETLTAAKNLVNGVEFYLRIWGNKVSAENPVYIKSVTVCDAAELGGGAGGEETGDYYVNFEGTASNPYYPQYVSQAANGLAASSDCLENYPQDTEKQYPRFNYTFIKVAPSLLTTVEAGATPVKLVIERKEGSTVNNMEFQYQIGGPGAVWSTGVKVTFDENGRFETTLLDAAFFNTLNNGSSIRLRDLHYVQSGNEEEGYTYAIYEDDDLSGIAAVRVYDLRDDCATYHDQFTEANKNLIWQGRVEPSYDEVGFSGNLICAHCGAIFKEGEELAKLGEYAKLDFSDGTMKQMSIGGIRPIGGGTSLVPVQIPGTDAYGLKLNTHNDGLVLKFSEFGHFTAEDIQNGQELAISVEYYVPAEVTNATRIVFDAQKGANKIMALYTNYSGVTWDAAVLNAAAPMAREQLNVATFTVGKNVDYVTGPGQFSAANKFTEPQTVNTAELAEAIVSGGEILLRGWGVNPKTADDPATADKDETAPERAVYIKSITVYDAKDVAKQEIDTSMEFIDYTSEFTASPVYYPQYKQIGSAYGIAGAQVTEQGSVETGDDITYVYFGVTDSLKKEGQEVNPVVIRIYFREGVERADINFAYQTAAPWTYITLDIVDGVAEGVLEDAAFTNGLNGKGSFRISNYSTDPIVDDIRRIEIFVIKDNTALVEALAQTDEIVKFKTPASVEAYMAVVAEAQAVKDNVWATEAEIAAAVAALEAAANALVDCDHACGTEAIGYVEATCFKAGYTGDLACKDCGYVAPENKGTEIPAHETEIINVKDATCKEEGNTGDLWCKVCEKVAKPGNVIQKLPHTWNEGEVTKEATATEYGEFTKTCTVCGEKLITRLDFEAQLGDVDGSGKVDSTDARLVLQFAVKKIAPTALDLEVADVDGSGKVDSTDARLVLQYAVKKIDKFPAA